MRRPRPATPAERAAIAAWRAYAARRPPRALTAETWLRCADQKVQGLARLFFSGKSTEREVRLGFAECRAVYREIGMPWDTFAQRAIEVLLKTGLDHFDAETLAAWLRNDKCSKPKCDRLADKFGRCAKHAPKEQPPDTFARDRILWSLEA